MSAVTVTLSVKDIEKITDAIVSDAPSVKYDIVLSRDNARAATRGAIAYWRDILEMQSRYLDDRLQPDCIEAIAIEAELDIDKIEADSVDLVDVEQFFLPEPIREGEPFSIADARVALNHKVISDLGSAWMALVRDAIQAEKGHDPMSGDGLVFPEGLTVEESRTDAGFTVTVPAAETD